jgi:hypothetical protein
VNESFEVRADDLERRVGELARRLDDMAVQTGINSREIATLLAKIDAIHSDLRDLKRLNEGNISRGEVQHILEVQNRRLELIEASVKKIEDTAVERQLATARELQHNTLVTYGTLISVLMGLIAAAAQFIGKN